MRKLSLVLALVVVFSMFLVACSSKPATSSTAPAPSAAAPASSAAPAPATSSAAPAQKENIVMRITWWGSQTRHDLTQEAIKLFEKNNPNIKMEAEFTAWDGYWDRLAAQIAGKNLADVFQQDYQYLKQYADNNIMLDITSYLGNAINTDNIEENTLLGGAVDGKVYAISLGLNSQCVVWDPELFEKAGVAAPPERWTWDQYIQTITDLHSKLGAGIYGEEYFTVNYYHGMNLWMRQHGFSFYADDGKSLGYTDDNLFAQYYEMNLPLVKSGAVAPPDISDEIKSVENQLIVTQKSAMHGGLGGSNQLAALVNAAGRPLKMTSLPYIEGEPSGQFLKPSQFFSVYSGSKYADDAVAFIDFVTNDVDANMILKGERGVPISSKIRDALAPTLDDTQKEIFRYIDSVSKFAHPIGLPEPPAHAEIDPILKNTRFQILSGQVTPLQGAQNFRKEAERVFAAQK